MNAYTEQRNRLVDHEVTACGVRDRRVLDAMRNVPREAFVPPHLADLAYSNTALPIGGGQTISQPSVVALMISALDLEGGERVLDVGTGSGYAAAVVAEIAAHVYSIERCSTLADGARDVLNSLGYSNVELRCGDGSLGWPEQAPFDAIIVSAAAPVVPGALREQLVIGGRLVLPIGRSRSYQTLVRVVRTGVDEYDQKSLEAVRFVPLVGAEGWEARECDSASGPSSWFGGAWSA